MMLSDVCLSDVCLTDVCCIHPAGRLDSAYWLIGSGSAGLAQGCPCALPLQAWVGHIVAAARLHLVIIMTVGAILIPVSLSVSILTAIFPGEPGLASFIEAKDDESGGDNWSYKSCKATVK